MRLFLLCVLDVLLCARSAWAVDPSKHVSQYAHTAWRLQDGFFSGAPHAIAQTADGYLWIGTEAGLVRFDGVRFVPWTPPQDTALPSPNIYSLLAADDGSVWIGTGRGVARWANGSLTTFPGIVGRINALLKDPAGVIWMVRSRVGGTVRGPLCRFEQSVVDCYGKEHGIECSNAGGLARDRLGHLWFGGSDGLCRWPSGEATTHLRNELEQVQGLAGIHAVAVGESGSLWVGVARSGAGLGLQHFAEGTWTSAIAGGLNGSTLEVTSLLVDRDNALWIGTMKAGIYRVHGGKVEHFGASDGLSSDSVDNLYQDREGNLWVVTSKGIDRFRDYRVTSLSVREGLTADRVNSVLAASDGSIWIGNQGSLDRLREGTPWSISSRDGLPGRNITSLFEDHARRIWVGVDGGLTVYEGGRFRRIGRRDGSSLGIIRAIVEDANHDVWILHEGQPRGLARIRDFEVREELLEPHIPKALALAPDQSEGIWLGLSDNGLARYRQGQFVRLPLEANRDTGAVVNLIADSDGSIWGATRQQGVVRWKEGLVKTLGVRNGLPCDGVFALIADDHRSLWLYTPCGLVVIARSELERWWREPSVRVTTRTFDTFDGVQPALSTFQPQASKSPDGRLWFANDSVLQVVDPNDVRRKNAVSPPVHIERVVADRRDYIPQEGLRLPAETRDIEVDYTANSFAIPERIHFQHKLDGYDRDWQDAGTRRQAFYTNLGPGTYEFRVRSTNEDGVWNDRGATLTFVVPPAWFQTNTFRSLCVMSGVLVAFALYRLRMRHMAHALNARFDERLAERTRIARDLHDTLLQTVQASKMVADDARDSDDREYMHRAIVCLCEWLDQAVQEGRAALNSLRTSPTPESDLIEAFRRTMDGMIPASMTVAFSAVGDPTGLHPIVRDEIYRVGCEAIRNACLHSAARRLSVELRFEHDLTIRVADDGVGIDSTVVKNGKSGHFGLQGMSERAARIGGKLTLVSSPAFGTEVTLVVPGNKHRY